jgi:hypothetical protein
LTGLLIWLAAGGLGGYAGRFLFYKLKAYWFLILIGEIKLYETYGLGVFDED